MTSSMPRSMRIIIADDDTDVLNSLKLVLTTCGYEVLTAESGNQALNTLRPLIGDTQPVTLLLTEVRLQDMEGVRLARSARDLIPDLPVIFMQGHPFDHIRQDISECEKCGYIEKPFTANTLLKVIDETNSFPFK